MSSQTPMIETTAAPTTGAPTPGIPAAAAPSASPPAAQGVLDPSAGEVVGRFLDELRRRDLDALALLLRDDQAVDRPAPDEPAAGRTDPGPTAPDSTVPDRTAPDRTAPDRGARDQAARDYAQVVLRSFSGSGLVETERHTSTDGQTVFVEFRRDHLEAAGWTEGRSGIRLLRFTTRRGAITGITEYAYPFAAQPRTDPSALGRGTRPGGAGAAPGRGGRMSDGLAWPSLDAVRPADPHTSGR